MLVKDERLYPYRRLSADAQDTVYERERGAYENRIREEQRDTVNSIIQFVEYSGFDIVVRFNETTKRHEVEEVEYYEAGLWREEDWLYNNRDINGNLAAVEVPPLHPWSSKFTDVLPRELRESMWETWQVFFGAGSHIERDMYHTNMIRLHEGDGWHYPVYYHPELWENEIEREQFYMYVNKVIEATERHTRDIERAARIILEEHLARVDDKAAYEVTRKAFDDWQRERSESDNQPLYTESGAPAGNGNGGA